jgi:accessory gene regulator protein AgrB
MQTTIHRVRGWFRNPLFLLALAAGLLAFSVQSGELGTSDTQHRLQTAHAWWTGQPQVFPEEYPEFGVRGRGGKIESWFGIGQSLLMFPADVLGTGLARLPIFTGYGGTDPCVTNIFVSYTTNILIAVLTALVCFRFLRNLSFGTRQSVAGTLALLLLTTHLHYTQNMQENNYICLLTLAGFCFQYEWLLTGSRRALLIGSGAFGLNLLTRLPTGMDLLAGGLFVLLVLWFEGNRGQAFWLRCRSYAATALPVYCFFGALDRLYQFFRFGSFFNTYIGLVAQEAKLRDPSLPANYPFTCPLHVGLAGALFSPEKSIFLFDPLLVLTILLIVVAWRRFSPPVKAYTITCFTLLAAYLCFYSRYFAWAGDFSWGGRYVSTTVQLAALLALPLLLRHRDRLARPVWFAGIALLGVSAIIQAVSLAFWLPLEIYQMETLGHPTYVIALRIENIVAFACGKMDAWGLNTPAMAEDPWDYVHITTWNFLPFLLRRVGEAPGWVVNFALALWLGAIAALASVLWRLRAVVSGLD